MSNRIIHEIRHGLLVLRVRRIRAADKRSYSVSLHRFYRNGELWSESTRFGPDDIPSLRYLLDEAHSWIIAQPREQQPTNRYSAPTTANEFKS